MKIIFVNRYFHPDESATSQLLTDLAFYLAGRGDEVHVVASRQRFDEPNAVLPRRERVSGVNIHRIWTTRFGRANLFGRALDYATFYPSAFWTLLCLSSRSSVIVAKTDPPLISVVAWLCARSRGAVLVNWVQDVFPEVAQVLGVRGAGGISGRVLRWLRNVSLIGAAANVALGERMAEYLAGQGIPKEGIRIIPNWVDGDSIRPLDPARNSLRRDWGLDGKFVVGYSGNMGRAHEFDAILGAAESLKSEPDVVFLFIGGGHGKALIEGAASARGLGNIRFKPFQAREALGLSLTVPDAHLISLRPEMEGFVQPSKFYGAIAAGRPVIFIGSPQGEFAAVLRKDECGRFVQIGDGNRLAEVIRVMRDDRALTALLGQSARKLFERSYDKPASVRAWESLLRGCATSAPY